MELPDLVRQELGDEEIVAGVSLGDDDAVCFTSTRTLVYRGEGLLSDEGVSMYPHEFERLAVSEGRRKTKFTLTYVDREEKFAVPGNRTSAVLERLLEGSLRVGGVLDADESVTGAYRFSELTLIVAHQRLLKHVGGYTWDEDYEAYAFDDVTGLEFEPGSVATAVVLEADGRRERIKAPNDEARVLRQTLEEALFEYYDVGSLDALNRAISVDQADGNDDASDGANSGGLDLESGIDPLVSDSDDAAEGSAGEPVPESAGPADTDDGATSPSPTGGGGATEQGTTRAASTVDLDAPDETTGPGRDEQLVAVTEQLEELTAAVERQNELVRQQQRTVEQLIEELRRGR